MALSQRRGGVQEMPNLNLAIYKLPLMNLPKFGCIVVWDYSDRNCLLESDQGKLVNDIKICSFILN